MKRKAQAEIIIIVILVALVVFAGYIVYQSGLFSRSIVPEVINEEQKTVKGTVESFILEGLNDVVEDVSSSGGMTTTDFYSMDNSDYATTIPENDRIVYWQLCGEKKVPDLQTISTKISEDLRRYIISNVDSLSFSKDVQISTDPTITTNIFDDRIDVYITLPTTVSEKTFSQYSLSLKTDFGKSYKFAKAFVEDNVNNRHFEDMVFNTISLSKMYSENFVPVTMRQIENIDSMVPPKPSIILAESVEDLAQSALNDVRLWSPGGEDSYLSIESLNGITFPDYHASEATYSQTNVRFYLAKQYEDMDSVLNPFINFKTDPDPVWIKNKSEFMIGLVLDRSNWAIPEKGVIALYSFSFPVVVSIKDSYTGNDFRFAVLNYIDFGPDENGDMKLLGDCAAFESKEECLADGAAGKISVVDTTNHAVENATITIGKCLFFDDQRTVNEWYTGINGAIIGKLPHGMLCSNGFKVEADGYQTYTETSVCNKDLIIDESGAGGKTVTLTKNPDITFKFYELFIEKKHEGETQCTSVYSYIINDDGNNPKEIDSQKSYKYYTFLKFKNTDDNSEYYVMNVNRAGETETTLSSVEEKNIPAGTYDVELFTFKSRTAGDVEYVDEDEILYRGFTGSDIGTVPDNYVTIDKSMPSYFEQDDTVSLLIFKSRPPCQAGEQCLGWNFISRIVGISTRGNYILILEESPKDADGNLIVKPGDEYQIVNLYFDNYMHVTDTVTIPLAASLPDGKIDYYVYIPRLQPGHNDVNSDYQKRLFNMIDYENQQILITNVMAECSPSISILETAKKTLTMDCKSDSEKESCWVTPWQMRGAGWGSACGQGNGCSYYSCIAGDTYATNPDYIGQC